MRHAAAKFFDTDIVFISIAALFFPGILLIVGWMLELGTLPATITIDGVSLTREVGLFQAAHWWFVELAGLPAFLVLLHVTGNSIKDFWRRHALEGRMLYIDGTPVSTENIDQAWVSFCNKVVIGLSPIFFISIIMGGYQFWNFSGCWLLTDGTGCRDIVGGPRGLHEGLPFWREWGIAASFSNDIAPHVNAVYTFFHYVIYTVLWGTVYAFFIMTTIFCYTSYIQSKNLREFVVHGVGRQRSDSGMNGVSFRNTMLLPNIVESRSGLDHSFDVDLFRDIEERIRIFIIIFVAIGAYFVVYNSYLQCPRSGSAIQQCSNLLTFARSLVEVIIENFQKFNAWQVLLAIRFEQATVFNYWVAATIIVASVLLFMYLIFSEYTFQNFRVALRTSEHGETPVRKYYGDVSTNIFYQAIGATRRLLMSRGQVVRTAAFCGMAILSAGVFWVAVVFVIVSLRRLLTQERTNL